MSFENVGHRYYHGKQYRHWDTSKNYDQQYQVFESTEVMPERLNIVTDVYPKVYEKYNINGNEERVVVDQAPEKMHVTHEYYELAPQQPLKPSHHHHHHPYVGLEDVDKEAEEFIKAEHRMFGLSKMMSRSDSRLGQYYK